MNDKKNKRPLGRVRAGNLRFLASVWIPSVFQLFSETASAEIKIDATKPAGPRVNYFGWDLKGWQDNTRTPERARALYGDTPANLVRIPIFARAHSEDGAIDKGRYGPMLESIAQIRQVNPDVKIFASIKLLGKDTFPAWIESDESGRIFEDEVKMPDPKKYAALVADYIGWLREEGWVIDFLGLGNETTFALTSDRYVETAHRLRQELADRKYEETYTRFQ